MNPLVKKVVAAVAVKEAIEKVQEMRRPKPSLWSRISPLAFLAAIGGALFYLGKSGKLGALAGSPAPTPATGTTQADPASL